MAHTPLEIESVLAAMGVESILRAEPKFGRNKFNEARDLPKRMREAFDRFFATSKFEPGEDLPPFDYDDVLKLVSAGQTPEQTEAIKRVMPDADMAMELGIEANRIIAWANQTIPREQRQTITGAKLDPPSPESLATFRTRWQVACDPMVVVRDMLEGCLDDDQVQTLALLYPTLYATMRQALADSLTAATMKHGRDWEPSPQKTAQIETLRQERQFDAALSATVQQSYADQSKPAPRPARRSPTDNTADLTPGQRAASGS